MWVESKDVGEIGIAWEEPLEPLGYPGDQLYSARDQNIQGWRTWSMEFHVEKLYKRCDALLRRLAEQEEIILQLMK